MSKKLYPTPFTLISTAWRFYRRQPVLNALLLWLFVVPVVAADLLPPLLPSSDPTAQLATQFSVSLLLIFLTLWGTAGVLLIGRRMIQSRAGRSRTSLRAVLQEAVPWVLPLFNTSLLAFCFTLYRSLLFFIPFLLLFMVPRFCGQAHDTCEVGWPIAIVLSPLLIPALMYIVQTTFATIALMTENVRYRKALQRSRTVVRGKFWKVLGTLLTLMVLLLFIPVTIAIVFQSVLGEVNALYGALGSVVSAFVTEFGALFFSLTLIPLFGSLRASRSHEVIAPEIDPS